MIIKIVTLFPKMFEGFIEESIINRAINNDLVKIEIVNLRDYSLNKHHKVDDAPYGGGGGMVLACDVVYRCLEDIKTDKSHIILTTPQGKTFKQSMSYSLARYEELIIICGHYEGFDERIRSFVDEEISIGDYVLTGGEIPAMAISDSVIRLLDGVIKENSSSDDSFSTGLLEYPQYTRPQEFMGLKVPDVLVNGNHKFIDEYRKKESLRKTYLRRRDLLDNYKLTLEEKKYLDEIISEESCE